MFRLRDVSVFVALPDGAIIRPFAVVFVVAVEVIFEEEGDDLTVFLRIDCLFPICAMRFFW